MSLHLFGTCKGSSQNKILAQFNADLWSNSPGVCNNYWGDLCDHPGQCLGHRGQLQAKVRPAEGDARVPGGLVRAPGAVPRTQGVLWVKVRPCGGRCEGAGGTLRNHTVRYLCEKTL